PLYTFLLAVGFFFTSNEKILSYALGLLFQAAFLTAAAAWIRARLGGWLLPLAGMLLLALEQNIGILAISGMETSLFLFLTSLAFWARARGRPRVLWTAAGLAVWVRPDALILIVLFALEAGLHRFTAPADRRDRRRPLSEAARAGAPAVALIAAYA